MLDQAPKCTPYRAVHMARQLVAKCSVGGKIAVGSLHSVVVKANTLGAHAHALATAWHCRWQEVPPRAEYTAGDMASATSGSATSGSFSRLQACQNAA
jgi:hypothetical protein